MLTLTENASTIVKTLVDQNLSTEDAGLRFSQEGVDSGGLTVTTAEQALPGDAVVVQDIPLLVETGQAASFDLVLVVEADPEIRVARLVQRGLTEEDARARIAAQATDEERRAVADAGDLEARGAMMLAATMAGVGFGSAGVHVPHACAYPIAGLKHVYRPPGYPDDHRFVPHGQSVIVTAPAAFRFTYEAAPERHHRVAELLAGTPIEDPAQAGPDLLPEVLRALRARGLEPGADVPLVGVCTDAEAEASEPALTNVSLEPRDVSRRAVEALFRLLDPELEPPGTAAAPGAPVELVPPRTLPRTSSGKLSRTKARNLYLSGEIQPYDIAA